MRILSYTISKTYYKIAMFAIYNCLNFNILYSMGLFGPGKTKKINTN